MIRIAMLCILLASVTAANGSPAAQQKPPRAPCALAVEQFCSDVPIGGGRRLACLAKHRAQLTPACRERLTALQKLFRIGQQQIAKTKAYLAKHDPEELKRFEAYTAGGTPPRGATAPHE
jgi:hypothetical protein